MSPRLAAAAVLLAGTTLLGGCAATVALEPAPDANNPMCAEVTVRLPDAIADEDRRWTDAQATGAWGNPVSVLLSCGVAVPAPTSELQCVTLDGIDWLVDASETPMLRLTTYGRDPAVQVYIKTTVVSSNDVIASNGLVSAVSRIPAEGRCTAPDELIDGVDEQLG